MSLTVIIRKKEPEVAIVQWFRDSTGAGDFATGPLVQMTFDSFRAIGLELMRRHFTDYFVLRVPRENITPVFRPGDAKKVMKGGRALDIYRLPSGEILLSPRVIQKYSLAHLKRVADASEVTIPADSAPDAFWSAFDTALKASEPDEIML